MTSKIVLYYSNRCIHCKNFKPEWNKILEMNNKSLNGKKLLVKDFEASQTYNDDDYNNINSTTNISGYPTILINNNNKWVEYAGPRTADSILNKATIDYNQQYLKYKSKYLNLKGNN